MKDLLFAVISPFLISLFLMWLMDYANIAVDPSAPPEWARFMMLWGVGVLVHLLGLEE